MKKLCREVWIEVDLDAIKKNVRAIRRHIPNTSKIMAVVKANAYGHGSVEVARQALESGASELAVASVEEGIVLRRAGITAPILVLGFTALSCVKKSAVWNITLSAFQVSWIKKANRILEKEADSKRLSIHINVDTGMGRLGVRTEEDLLAVVKALKSSTYLSWDGIFTHFSTADEPDTELTMPQRRKVYQLSPLFKKSRHYSAYRAYVQYSRRYRIPGIQRRHDPFRHWVIWFISVRLDKGTEPRRSHTRTKFKGAYRLCESHGDRSPDRQLWRHIYRRTG